MNEKTTDETHHDDVSQGLIVSLNVLPLLILCVTVLFGFMWYFQPVRRVAINFLSDAEIRFAAVALEDPDEEIATDVCRSLMEREVPVYLRDDVEAKLSARRKIALNCLTETTSAEKQAAQATKEQAASEDESSGDSTEDAAPGSASERQHLSRKIGRIWLSQFEQADPQSCALAQDSRRLLADGALYTRYRFLRCATRAETKTARDCCRDIFVGEADTPNFSMETPQISIVADDLDQFARRAFPSEFAQAASSGDTTGEGDSESDSGQADSSGPDLAAVFEGEAQTTYQDWVIEKACQVHFESPSTRRAIASLKPVVESDGCAPTEEPWIGFYDPSNWTQTCGVVYQSGRESGMSPKQALCTGLKEASIEDAMLASRNASSYALGVARQSDGVGASDEKKYYPGGRARGGPNIIGFGPAGRRSSHSRSSTRFLQSFVGAMTGY